MNTQQTLTGQMTQSKRAAPFTWRTLLYMAAGADLLVLVAMGVTLRDRLPLGLALFVALGLALLNFRGGWLGVIGLGLLFTDTTVWTLSAAVMNVLHGEELLRIFLPAALAAISSAGAIAAVGGLVRRRQPLAGSTAAQFVGLGALFFFVLVVGAGVVRTEAQTEIQPAVQTTKLELRTENMAFSTTELTAKAGQITLVVDNRDLWWHTLTIDALGVNLNVPSSAKQTITFTAKPGVYVYYCAIPGHKMSGMEGKLIVR
ncbi:MAG: cupredoxin domain-containing protein [Caldilineaceae bacterium]